jgi:hypothetical protein
MTRPQPVRIPICLRIRALAGQARARGDLGEAHRSSRRNERRAWERLPSVWQTRSHEYRRELRAVLCDVEGSGQG